MTLDYYAVLGGPRMMKKDKIKKAYRKLAMRYHPDKVGAEEKVQAEAKFKEITEAYEVLRDPEKRTVYDRYGAAGLKRGGGGAGDFGFAQFDLAEALNVFMRDFGGLGGLDTLFGGGERARRERHRGQDLKVTLQLDLSEVASGTTKTVKLRTLDRCTACAGSGAAAGTRATTCGTCGGTGEVRRAARSIGCAPRGCRASVRGGRAICTCACTCGRLRSSRPSSGRPWRRWRRSRASRQRRARAARSCGSNCARRSDASTARAGRGRRGVWGRACSVRLRPERSRPRW